MRGGAHLPSRQRGIALLVAIVMFAIATTVAAAITYDKAMAARRAAATFTLEQALQAGMAAEALAAIALEDDARHTQTVLSREWAQPLPPTEIEGTAVVVAGQIEDLSGRFNLNSVVAWDGNQNALVRDQRQVEVFENLLRALDIDPSYAELLVDWLDSDTTPQLSGGGEDTLYLTQTPPYRPPNTLITHPSELLALPKFGAENYAKIAPYVTALPWYVVVNACTASGLVLDMNNNDGQDQWRAAPLDAMRKNGCGTDKSTIRASFSDPNKWGPADAHYVERSDWFRLRTNVRIGTAEFVLYSVLYREPTGNRVRTVQRSFGSE
ncbi:MAG TPA: type II secretion system minor pseudopilin GspK [Steroidobacteraceae bacterium]|jgi:general secretion pathway protein K